MDAPSISIKIKGLRALQALNGNGPMMGGIKINGMNALMGMRGMEGNRAMMMNKGLMMREMEDGGRRMLMQPPDGGMSMGGGGGMGGGGMGATGQGGAAKGAVAKSAAASPTVKTAAAKTALGTGPVKGIGYALGLGGLGPWLALAALGLAVTGVYFYMRAQQIARSSDDFGDLDASS